jgi:hypothetical protein
MQLLSSASAALQKSDPKLSLETSRRTFGALLPSIPCTTARHNLATSFTRALSEPNLIATHQQTPACARELASKRALHPIHNVKQPKNKVDDPQIFEPCPQFSFFLERSGTAQGTGGAERDRTDDLLLAKQALSQLSYGPTLEWIHVPGSAHDGPSPLSASSLRSQSWWAREDLNFRPHAYQARALTN